MATIEELFRELGGDEGVEAAMQSEHFTDAERAFAFWALENSAARATLLYFWDHDGSLADALWFVKGDYEEITGESASALEVREPSWMWA